MLAPCLASITSHPTGGGIAVVSRLLWRAIEVGWGARAVSLAMFDHANAPATLTEKAKFSLELGRLQATHQTDWLLFSHLGLARTQGAVPAPFRVPYGIFLHGMEAWRTLGRSEERALLAADLLLANSHFTAERVRSVHPGVGAIHVCHLALEPSPTTAVPWAVQEAGPFGPHAVLVVGRMADDERYKGHDQLIEAWSAVVDAVPDAHLVVVGDGNDAERLREKAGTSSASDSIVFTGFVDAPTLDALYRQAALFALPSRGEGFGLVYLEAMARGLPCVGSIHDAAREVIVDGVTGRLVDQADPDNIAGTIASLLLDEELRASMGTAARARVQSDFSFARFQDRLLRILPANTLEPVRA